MASGKKVTSPTHGANGRTTASPGMPRLRFGRPDGRVEKRITDRCANDSRDTDGCTENGDNSSAPSNGCFLSNSSRLVTEVRASRSVANSRRTYATNRGPQPRLVRGLFACLRAENFGIVKFVDRRVLGRSHHVRWRFFLIFYRRQFFTFYLPQSIL